MELKYILSVNFETLTDEERDELYTAIAWFDCNDIDTKRCRPFIKISQELLKYKGEQVETLLHELEEMAVKQGEDEAKRQESEAETKSGRSRKSSSIEHENLEQKYLELKSKHKKLLRSNDKKDAEIEKLTKRIVNLERENKKLQNELESTPRVLDSESDVSETVKDQQKELVQTIHNKNKQISDLLRDIEEVENENYVLRDKLSNVRDELSVATREINNMTDLLKERDAAIKESLDQISQLRNESVKLKAEKQQIEKLKNEIEKELKDSVKKCKEQVEELTKLCTEKDCTINDLKGKLKEPSLNSSISSLPKDESEVSHVNAIQKLLAERDKQLMELKIQLHAAAKEMEESTGLIKSLKMAKEKDETALAGLEGQVKELKKQLKGVHERCRSLQEEVEFAEKTAHDKNEELKQILNKLNENGQVELVVNLQEIQMLKADNRLKEKQIAGLVKVSNKLQETCDRLEKESVVLREQVGLAEEEPVSLTSYNKKEKKRQKEMESLKTKLRKLEEANIQLKSDIHKLNQVNSSLTNQILELGQKPNTHRYQTSSNDRNLKNDYKTLAEENKTLAEENEALRKGLHEILNSVNVKRSSTSSEIKSETLEQLLRALDVKHISGWYHPAMRLQAELHNIEGINAELRNQLKDARVQLQWYQSTDESLGEKRPESSLDQTESIQIGEFENFEVDDVNSGLKRFFEIIKIKTPKIEGIQEKLMLSLKKFTEEKKQVDDELSQAHNTLKEIKEEMNLLEEKLNILECDSTDERVKNLDEILKKNMSLKRQTSYLENENKKLSAKLENAYKDMSNAEGVYLKNVGDLQRKNSFLENQLKVMKNLSELSIDYEVHKETEKNLNEITIKYRALALDMKRQTEEQSLEMKMLQESQKASEAEKNELKKKLMDVSSRLALQNVQKVDEKIERLAQKLSEVEMTELTERQRANHTNNLYELVKEQLKKSEERFQEYSKYNEELLKKNLVLQEQLGEAEGKIVDFVDKKLYQQLKLENNNLLSETEKLTTNLSELEEALKLEKTNYDNQKTWNDHKEQELLNLKHQIVDLVSITDEKVIISQLNNDILQCRQSQAYYRTKYKETIEELGSVKEKLDKHQAKYEDERNALIEKETILNEKIINLQKLMQKQKLQYIGCIPLCSEENYLDLLKYITKERHDTFLNLCKSKTLENEAALLKEQLEIEVNYVNRQKEALLNGGKEEMKNILNWLQEKKALQINELRYKRQAEFKEQHLKHFSERIQLQDEQILKLEEELLMWQKNLDVIQIPSQNSTKSSSKPLSPKTNSINSQTVEVQTVEPVTKPSDFELNKLREELVQKNESMNQLKNKLTELEMSASIFKKQLSDRQSQITFYERHIMELQNKKEEIHPNGAGGDNLGVGVEANINEELIALKASAKTLQDNLKAKEDEIMRYQTLLKVDRDKHSLAAATLQEELKGLQRQLSEERQKTQSLEETFAKSRPNKAALDDYMEQVNALEKHTSDLHTKVISLETQLQSSKDEATRWKNLANDRLFAMEELGKNLDEQHKHELMAIKSDTEKLKELTKDEMNNLRQLLDKQRVMFSGKIDIDLMKLVTEKDEKINELSTKLRIMKKSTQSDTGSIPNLDLEGSFDLLQKENEVLKKRCEQLLIKERNAKEEIRDLKAQLLKKPMSARCDKTEKSIKEQLQRKVLTLESEVESLKRSLTDQISINETHKVQATDDFDKWKKLKHWQQTAEKLKNKLKERESDFEKMQQTSVGYRMLIERLEREKHNLENRIKSLKSNHPNSSCNREVEYLRLENLKLQSDLDALNSRLEMNQHHSGGLGAAMMQEKLESQERKIAVLELSSKGTVEMRAELERSQAVIANLQKSNLRLEAENLEMKLDQEKCNKEVPHLLQQIQHLESYIEVLKNENTQFEAGTSDEKQLQGTSENKRVSELERTVFVLKRVVEKLQAENKRLMNGKRPISDRAVSADRVKRENCRLKEKYAESIEKTGKLEQELSLAKSKFKNVSVLRKPDDSKLALCEELAKVKEQLEQKSSLLDKVKLLLTRAAAKEKLLLQEITELKSHKEVTVVAPIPEESEESSSDI